MTGTPDSNANSQSIPLSSEYSTLQNQLELLRKDLQRCNANFEMILNNQEQTQPASHWFERFCSSGFFFIVLGILLLVTAYVALEFGVHTSFSFVLVVLGMAILLFGTGTQGVGKLESKIATAQYNVAIAGGAGALALAIGLGMVEFGPGMQRAFGVETRYVVAMLRPKPDGSSTFDGYWAEFDVDGVPIPTVRRGDVILAYIPYFSTQLYATKRVNFRMRPQNLELRNPALKPALSDTFEVPLAKVDLNNSALDFPLYEVTPPIDMKSTSSATAGFQAAAAQTLPSAPNASSPNAIPPAVVQAQ